MPRERPHTETDNSSRSSEPALLITTPLERTALLDAEREQRTWANIRSNVSSRLGNMAWHGSLALVAVPALTAIVSNLGFVICGAIIGSIYLILWSLFRDYDTSDYFKFVASDTVDSIVLESVDLGHCSECHPGDECEKVLTGGSTQAIVYNTEDRKSHREGGQYVTDYSCRIDRDAIFVYSARFNGSAIPGVTFTVKTHSHTDRSYGAGDASTNTATVLPDTAKFGEHYFARVDDIAGVKVLSVHYLARNMTLTKYFINTAEDGVTWSNPRLSYSNVSHHDVVCAADGVPAPCLSTLLPGNGSQELLVRYPYDNKQTTLTYDVPCMNGNQTATRCELKFAVNWPGPSVLKSPEGYDIDIQSRDDNYLVNMRPHIEVSASSRPQNDLLLMLAAADKLGVPSACVNVMRDFFARNPSVGYGVKNGFTQGAGNVAAAMLVREQVIARENASKAALGINMVGCFLLTVVFSMIQTGDVASSVAGATSRVTNIIMMQTLLTLAFSFLTTATNNVLPKQASQYTGRAFNFGMFAAQALSAGSVDDAATAYYVADATREVVEDAGVNLVNALR